MKIKPVNQWTFTQKMAGLASVLSVLILLGNASDALNTLEPWQPATHGWVREWAKPIVDERNDRIRLVQDETNEKLTALQLMLLESRLQALRSEGVDLELKLRALPDDSMLLRRQTEVRAMIDRLTKEYLISECALRRIGNPNAVC